MKKFFIILAAVIAVLLIALFTLPYLFKDKIRAAIDDAINKNINAKVYFAPDKFDLTFFRKFPNLSVSLGDFGVVGIDEFQGDTLADIKSFNLTIDVFSLMGDKIKIKGLVLDSPTINAKVLKSGKANWDIAKPSEDTTQAQPEPGKKSTFGLGIDHWEIKNGNIEFDDRKTPQFAKIVNLNHSGKGDITQDVYDLSTKTSIDNLIYKLDSVSYFANKRVEADMVIVMDKANSKYTFKDNKFKINEFEFGFNGFLTMPTEGMYIDMTFQSRETAFKNILSLVPGIYTESFKDLKAEGEFGFDGFAKGWKKENSLPAFGLNVKIEKGKFQYPSLPTAVSNVFLDMNVANTDGIMDNTIIDIKKFHLDLGKNPVDARMRVAGLTDYGLDGEVKAKVDLAEISSIFPMKGLSLKGLLGVDIVTKGTYSKAKKMMPTINAGITLANGFVKSDKFPAPIEKIELQSQANNPTGQLNDTKVDVKKLNFELDGEPFATTMTFSNFEDLIYDVKAKGIINLDKMTKIYPLEGMSLSGIINANIETKGQLSDVQSGKYINCPTSGTLGFKSFVYSSPSLKQGFKMSDANFVLSPEKIDITNLVGSIGKSDIKVDGYISNYMQYTFTKGTLKGLVNFYSANFNADEWTGGDEPKKEEPEQAPKPDEPSSVYEVPKNLDFTLNSKIDNLIYSNYGITNLGGAVVIKDGIMNLNNLLFTMLDGKFATNGVYNTKDMNHPLFDFSLNMDRISIQKAVTTFSFLKAYVKDPNTIQGTASSNFKINGELAKNNKPINETMYGKGMINVLDATVKNKALTQLAEVSKMNEFRELKMNNVQIQGEIKNGRLYLSPFDVNTGNVKSNISGSQGIDGSLDYLVKMDVPTGQVGAAASGALAKFTGVNLGNMDRVVVSMKVTGTSDKPIITPSGVSQSGKQQTVKQQVQQQAQQQVQQVKQQVQQQVQQEVQQQIANPNPEEAKKKVEDAANKLKNQFKFP